jgi:hypothetical protein
MGFDGDGPESVDAARLAVMGDAAAGDEALPAVDPQAATSVATVARMARRARETRDRCMGASFVVIVTSAVGASERQCRTNLR